MLVTPSGTYDTSAASTVLGKRVSGGRWGGSERFCHRTGEPEHDLALGPGKYDPNQSVVSKKRPGVKIVAPTKKTLAAHIHAFERQEAERGLGPGKYSPSFSATSDWLSGPRVAIRPKTKPNQKLQEKILEREELAAGQAPGAYEWGVRSEFSSCTGTVSWRPEYAPRRELAQVPGPGSYDPDVSAVKGKTAWDVRMAPSESDSKMDRSAMSVRSSFLHTAEGPGPGAYDVQDDLLHPRPGSTVIKQHETMSLKQKPTRQDGDILVLNPDDSYTRPNVRCSVVMREESFVSQASTAVADDSRSENASAYDVDLSVLSTKHRSLSFSMDGQGIRRDPKESGKLGPGYYNPMHRAVEIEPRATRVLSSITPRSDVKSKVGSDSCKLVLDTERADQYLRSSVGVPDIGRFSARSSAVAGQGTSAFTGESDYEADEAARTLLKHTPTLDMGKVSQRKDIVENKEANPKIGPGAYDVDDSLVHPRVPTAFISNSTVREDDMHDYEGDELVLEPTAADRLVRKATPALVNMEKTVGRVEPKKDPLPEALQYAPAVLRGSGDAVPGVAGFRFEDQVGRIEPKTASEGEHLFGKYSIDYSQVEAKTPAVDFSHGSARNVEGESRTSDKLEGDILVLDTERAQEYIRGSRKLVPDMSKQVSRPEEVAGQGTSAFTGESDYEADEAARTLLKHTPTLDMGKVSQRKDIVENKEANPKIGPGAYDVDDSLVHPRVPTAFISNLVAFEPEIDEDGDVLDLEVALAEGFVRKRTPAPVDMAKSTGRVEAKADEKRPEALEYLPDSRDRIQPGQLIPGVPTVAFAKQTGRKEVDVVKGEGCHLQGKYNPVYSLVEKEMPAPDFGKLTGRSVEGADASIEVSEGDVLDLDAERGLQYLREKKLVSDMSKQTSRPEEVTFDCCLV